MLNIDDRLIKEVSPKIGANALSVLLAIAIHLNQRTNRCFPSHYRLMELTGMGKNAVYDALKVLKKEGLLMSEQKVDSKNKRFSKRVFRLTTRFIKIFVDAEDADPLPESREPENRDTENREPEMPHTENWETKQINQFQQINYVEQINQFECGTPAQNSPTLETKPALEGEFPAGPAAPQLPPRWTEIPNVNTSGELRTYLSAFYRAYPEEWRNTKDGTPAVMWPDEKTKEVVSRFCDWALTEGLERRTLKQINARLKMWLKDEPHMSRKAPQQDTRPLRAMKVYGQ